jgi:hypothetical protein
MSTDPKPEQKRLDEIPTHQSLVYLALYGRNGSEVAARRWLTLRYRGAIRRYLGGWLKNDDWADEAAQEVSTKMLDGDFGQWDPATRFRDLVRIMTINSTRECLRQSRKESQLDPNLVRNLAAIDPDEGDWVTQNREMFLEAAWKRLEQYQKQEGNQYHTVLRLRHDYPNESSDELAVRLSAIVNKLVTPESYRQTLRRARLKFAEFIVAEIKDTLTDPTPERIGDELRELDLYEYVKDFLPPDWSERGELRDTE